MSAQANAGVVEVRDVGDRHAVVRIQRDAGPLPHLPGQYVEVGGRSAGVDWRQPYSIASAPGAPELELFVQMSGPAQRSFAMGERVWVADTADGYMTTEGLSGARGLLLIGTGSGVAPFVSIARAVVPARRFRHVWLVHGAHTPAELAFDTELKTLAATQPGFSWIPVLDQGGTPLAVVQDVVDPARFVAWAGEPLLASTIDVFLCGHPAMVSDLEGRLTALGFGASEGSGRVHTERSG